MIIILKKNNYIIIKMMKVNNSYENITYNPAIHNEIMASIKEEDEEFEVMRILFECLSL